jgi:hypothetical protein
MEQARLGFLFGVFAGILLFVGALLTLGISLVSLPSHGYSTNILLGATSQIVLAVVIGLLFVFFAAIGSRRQGDYTLAGGIVLIILALGTWFVLGLGLLSVLAGLLGLIAGILMILERR